MGRMLGSYSDDQSLDRPDLNKCPDCDCYFATDNCPLCGKPCPENMRAGNRPAEKKRRKRSSSGSGRVTFVEWYHSWWFIAVMLFLFPLIGIILLATSPHKGWKKGVFIVLAILYGIVSTFGFSGLFSGITDLWDHPVDTSLIRDEYIAVCETISPEQFYRAPEAFEDDYVCLTLRVEIKASLYNSDDTYYVCRPTNGGSYYVIVRDCLLDGARNFIPGDVITVYGEGAEECTVIDAAYDSYNGPCVNMAYAVRQ